MGSRPLGSSSRTASWRRGPSSFPDLLFPAWPGGHGPFRSEARRLGTYTATWYTNPATGKAWTISEVNALQAGVESADLKSTTYQIRVTRVDVVVKVVETKTFVYDAVGNLRSAAGKDATVAYTYDGLNRILTETYTIGGAAYPLKYAYDAASRVTKLMYPDGSALTYGYDALGRTRTASYGSTTYLDLGYTYDQSGNVKSMGTESFTYDRLDRLKTASGGYGDLSWTYDEVGNRLSETRGTTTTSYSYDYDKLDQLTSHSDGSTTISFTYEGNGNLQSKTGGWSYAWNFDHLLTRVTKDGSQVRRSSCDAVGRRLRVEGSFATSWAACLFSG